MESKNHDKNNAQENSEVSVPYIEVDDKLQYAWRLSRAAEILKAVCSSLRPAQTV
jgi:hypothetical protein